MNMPQSSVPFCQDPVLLNALSDLIQTVGSASVNVHLYPPGATIVSHALNLAMASIKTILRDRPTVTLSENDKILIADDQVLPKKFQAQASVKFFINMMTSRNIHSMTFHRGVATQEVLDFISLLGKSPEEISLSESLTKLMSKQGIRNIQVDETFIVRIRKGEGIGAAPDVMTDGKFFQDLVEGIFTSGAEIQLDEYEQVKKKIDFEKLRAQSRLDFDEVGIVLNKALAAWAHLDLLEAAASARDTSKIEWAEKLSAGRVRQVAGGFALAADGISKTVEPDVRQTLADHYVRLARRLHGSFLTEILQSKTAGTTGGELKVDLVRHLALKEKLYIVEQFNKNYIRGLNGLKPEDFEIVPETVKESKIALKNLLDLSSPADKRDLSLKVQLALGNARLLSTSMETPEKFLALKTKRLLSQPPASFLSDSFLDGFGELAHQLIRHDGVKHLFSLMQLVAVNFATEDSSVTDMTIRAFERMHEQFGHMRFPEGIEEGCALLAKLFRRDYEKKTIEAILGFMESQFGKLLDRGEFASAEKIVSLWIRERDLSETESERRVLSEFVERLRTDAESIGKVIAAWIQENEQVGDQVTRLLSVFDPMSICPHVFRLLRDSDEMRIRKKCTMLAQRIGKGALDPLLKEINPSNPWYYSRNLLTLMGDIGDESVIPRIQSFLNDSDEHLRKAAISTFTKIGGTKANIVLLDHFPTLPDPVRKMVISQLGANKCAAAVPKLIELAQWGESGDSLTAAIIKALGEIGDPSAAPAVSSFIKKSGIRGLFSKQSDEIVLEAVTALANLGDQSAIPLIQGFVHHANPAISMAAQQSISSLSAS